MNKRILAALGLGAISFGALIAADNKYAKLVDQTTASVQSVGFKDIVGTPFTKNWRARFLLGISVFNPTNFSFPLTLDQVNLVVNNGLVTGYLARKQDLIIDPEFNIFQNLVFEVPLDANLIQTIQGISNPRIMIKARVYQLPIDFTYNLQA